MGCGKAAIFGEEAKDGNGEFGLCLAQAKKFVEVVGTVFILKGRGKDSEIAVEGKAERAA